MHAVHDQVAAARDGLAGLGGESTRILLNAFKVFSHLYESLVYCVHWPAAMLKLRDALGVLSFNFFAGESAACFIDGVTYYWRLVFVSVAPFLIVVALVGLGMLAAIQRRKKQRTQAIAPSGAAGSAVVNVVAAQRLKRVDTTLKAGMWATAHLSLFILDLLYPTITRTLMQFLSCRDLGEASFVESDYSVECYTDKYWGHFPLMLIAAVSYAFGPVDDCGVCALSTQVSRFLFALLLHFFCLAGSQLCSCTSATTSRSLARRETLWSSERWVGCTCPIETAKNGGSAWRCCVCCC